MATKGEKRGGQEWVAIVLGIGIAVAVNLVTFGLMWEAVFRSGTMSDNATQLLTTAFGGIVGVLGSYVGFRSGIASERRSEADKVTGAKVETDRAEAEKVEAAAEAEAERPAS